MFQYDISDQFLNNDIDYPFNIMDRNGNLIENFWDEIEHVMTLLKNDKDNSVRFMWIEAEGYCQTEVFLKKILQNNHDKSPVLYLHWIDYIYEYKDTINPVTIEVKKARIGKNYFADDPDVKICVIDHAEKIEKIEHYINLYKSFKNCGFIFIFISKRRKSINCNRWNRILQHADDNLGIIRSEENFYYVKRYSVETCKELIKRAVTNEIIKKKSLDIAETLSEDLRRSYYFDLFLKSIKSYSTIEELPDSFDDISLLKNVYENAISGIINHLISEPTFRQYIDSYYKSDFVVNNQLKDSQKREPIDDYVWAYGIIKYTPKNNVKKYYQDTIKFLFEYKEKEENVVSPEHIRNIANKLISVFDDCFYNCNNENYFSFKEFLTQLLNYNLHGAVISAMVLNDSFEHIDESIISEIFLSLCNRYKEHLKEEKDIYFHTLLGMEIGKILPNISNSLIIKGLDYFFKEVTDDFIYPVCNDKGISVVPVTNFEFLKFVEDCGYRHYYDKEIDIPLKDIAINYYREIFDFIISSLDKDNAKGSKFLANILKGYDWLQYKQIAYLFVQKDTINIGEIYKSIQEKNYPHPLKHPAKWIDDKNSDTSKAFCNPLQPVVCVNLFEARAYAKWLSDKIKKPVRIVKYDPDYISTIGTIINDISDSQRNAFLNHLKENKNYINTVENRKLFYGSDDIELREPSPVSIPNSYFAGIYDFLGNVFETQDTCFNYHYNKRVSNKAIEIFEKKDAALVDYNCPCGGLQRTTSNLPPEYMGQVPAFLRNQDIGFRIVIGGKDKIGINSDNQLHNKIEYYENQKTVFHKINTKKIDKMVFGNISVNYIDKLNHNVIDILKRILVYGNEQKSIAIYSAGNNQNKLYDEAIMLIYDGKSENIYAYHLLLISSVKTYNADQNIQLVFKHPKIPSKLALRKNYENQSLADWIDVLEINKELISETYSVYPLNIINSYFDILPRKLRKAVVNGTERKKNSSISGLYKISFCNNKLAFRNSFFDDLKFKLGTDFFLPDWINIVEYINYISLTIPNTNKPDIDAVMAAITTIDTSDLHEKINEKKLVLIDNELRGNYEKNKP